MADLLIPVAIIAALAAIVGALWWLAVRVRHRGGGGVLGPFEEVWHPAAHRTRLERREQAEVRAPAPSPDGL